MEGRLGLSEVWSVGGFYVASGGSLGAQSELYCAVTSHICTNVGDCI